MLHSRLPFKFPCCGLLKHHFHDNKGHLASCYEPTCPSAVDLRAGISFSFSVKWSTLGPQVFVFFGLLTHDWSIVLSTFGLTSVLAQTYLGRCVHVNAIFFFPPVVEIPLFLKQAAMPRNHGAIAHLASASQRGCVIIVYCWIKYTPWKNQGPDFASHIHTHTQSMMMMSIYISSAPLVLLHNHTSVTMVGSTHCFERAV